MDCIFSSCAVARFASFFVSATVFSISSIATFFSLISLFREASTASYCLMIDDSFSLFSWKEEITSLCFFTRSVYSLSDLRSVSASFAFPPSSVTYRVNSLT